MDLWDNVKGFYKEKFDIEPEIVELFCDFSVLLLCVSGSSNKHISEFLDMDIEEVKDIIKKHYSGDSMLGGFSGFYADLNFNPIKVYRDKSWGMDIMYNRLCERFVEWEKLLNDNWI